MAKKKLGTVTDEHRKACVQVDRTVSGKSKERMAAVFADWELHGAQQAIETLEELYLQRIKDAKDLDDVHAAGPTAIRDLKRTYGL